VYNGNSSHPLKRSQRKQAHRRTEHIASADKQPQPGDLLLRVLLVLDWQYLPRRANRMRQSHCEGHDAAGLVCAKCRPDDVWICAEQKDNLTSLRLGE